MKNLFILFLFAFVPFSFVSAQEINPIGAEAAEFTECEVECLLTKCKIKCPVTQGVANCGCWFGLAQCTCAGVSGDVEVEQTEQQAAALKNYQSELRANGYGDVAEVLGQIQNKINRGGNISSLLETYGSLIESKSSKDRKTIDGLNK